MEATPDVLSATRPSLYPIIDFRALWTLGIDKPPAFCGFGVLLGVRPSLS
jgi:hypothetical protein